MPGLNKNRKRNMTIAFRVSPEENELVTLLAKTANMTKQNYIMSKLTDTEVVVMPNSRTYKALKDEMAKVYAELVRIKRADELDESLLQRIDVLTEVFGEFGQDMPESILDVEDSMIAGMTRG